MQLSDLGLPKEREELIKDLCKIMNAQSVTVAEDEFGSEWWKPKKENNA